MAELNMASVGVCVCGMKCISHADKESLSQYDIVIFNADIIGGLGLLYESLPSGEEFLSRSDYLKLNMACNHWHQELNNMYQNGKLVFILSSPQEKIMVHSGGVSYEKNKVQTYRTSMFDTYSCLPLSLVSRNTNGDIMKMVKHKYQNITKELYEKLQEYTYFDTEFTEVPDGVVPVLTTRTGDTIGFLCENSKGGKYLFWPRIDMDNKKLFHYNEEKNQTFWTKEGEKVGNIIIQELTKLYKTKNFEKEPIPDWVRNNNAFVGKKEAELLTDKKDTEEQIKTLTEHLTIIDKDLEQEEELKVLLYGTGHELEKAVNKALGILGLQAENYKHPTETLEIDNLIKYDDMEIIGETEGKEKDIHNDKISQLVTNLSQYYTLEIDLLTQKPKGVLFGNPERKTPCENRQLTFTEKCMQISRTEKIALVLTKDLFGIALYLKDHPDESYKKACVDAIINTESGIVQFPDIPEKV